MARSKLSEPDLSGWDEFDAKVVPEPHRLVLLRRCNEHVALYDIVYVLHDDYCSTPIGTTYWGCFGQGRSMQATHWCYLDELKLMKKETKNDGRTKKGADEAP